MGESEYKVGSPRWRGGSVLSATSQKRWSTDVSNLTSAGQKYGAALVQKRKGSLQTRKFFPFAFLIGASVIFLCSEMDEDNQNMAAGFLRSLRGSLSRHLSACSKSPYALIDDITGTMPLLVPPPERNKPTHVALCEEYIARRADPNNLGQAINLVEDLAVCDDWSAPHYVMMDIFASALVASAGSELGLRYSDKCHHSLPGISDERTYDHTSAQQLLADPLVTDNEKEVLGEGLIEQLCQGCVEEFTKRDLTTYGDSGTVHQCILFPDRAKNSPTEDGKAAFFAVLPTVVDRIRRVATDYLDRANPLENERTSGAVIFLDDSSTPMNYSVYDEHLPNDLDSIQILASASCVHAATYQENGCLGQGVRLQKYLVDTRARPYGTKIRYDAVASTAASYARMVNAFKLVCPPETVSCLLPAISKMPGTSATVSKVGGSTSPVNLWWELVSSADPEVIQNPVEVVEVADTEAKMPVEVLSDDPIDPSMYVGTVMDSAFVTLMFSNVKPDGMDDQRSPDDWLDQEHQDSQLPATPFINLWPVETGADTGTGTGTMAGADFGTGTTTATEDGAEPDESGSGSEVGLEFGVGGTEPATKETEGKVEADANGAGSAEVGYELDVSGAESAMTATEGDHELDPGVLDSAVLDTAARGSTAIPESKVPEQGQGTPPETQPVELGNGVGAESSNIPTVSVQSGDQLGEVEKSAIRSTAPSFENIVVATTVTPVVVEGSTPGAPLINEPEVESTLETTAVVQGEISETTGASAVTIDVSETDVASSLTTIEPSSTHLPGDHSSKHYLSKELLDVFEHATPELKTIIENSSDPDIKKQLEEIEMGLNLDLETTQEVTPAPADSTEHSGTSATAAADSLPAGSSVPTEPSSVVMPNTPSAELSGFGSIVVPDSPPAVSTEHSTPSAVAVPGSPTELSTPSAVVVTDSPQADSTEPSAPSNVVATESPPVETVVPLEPSVIVVSDSLPAESSESTSVEVSTEPTTPSGLSEPFDPSAIVIPDSPPAEASSVTSLPPTELTDHLEPSTVEFTPAPPAEPSEPFDPFTDVLPAEPSEPFDSSAGVVPDSPPPPTEPPEHFDASAGEVTDSPPPEPSVPSEPISVEVPDSPLAETSETFDPSAVAIPDSHPADPFEPIPTLPPVGPLEPLDLSTAVVPDSPPADLSEPFDPSSIVVPDSPPAEPSEHLDPSIIEATHPPLPTEPSVPFDPSASAIPASTPTESSEPFDPSTVEVSSIATEPSEPTSIEVPDAPLTEQSDLSKPSEPSEYSFVEIPPEPSESFDTSEISERPEPGSSGILEGEPSGMDDPKALHIVDAMSGESVSGSSELSHIVMGEDDVVVVVNGTSYTYNEIVAIIECCKRKTEEDCAQEGGEHGRRMVSLLRQGLLPNLGDAISH